MNKRSAPALLGLLAAVCIVAFIITAQTGEGVHTADGWHEDNGQPYYKLSDGSPAAGWLTIEDTQYYFNSDGTPVTGWLELEGRHYYFRDSGSLVTGWLSLEGKRYYLGSDGAAVTGPSEIDGCDYLFDEDGILASGIILVDGCHYIADENGHPLSGWGQNGTTRYYFDENGKAVSGWQTIDGLEYYFYSDGSPAAGITQLDDRTYYFSSGGQYLPLVNPWHYVPEDYTVELAEIDDNHRIAALAYADMEEMLNACRSDGLDPAICSSYRTQEYQEILFSRKMKYYTGKGYSEDEARQLAGQSVAVPGTSEHQLGLALDIIDNGNWNLNESQANTETQKWLMAHSWEYGWILRYPDGKSDITGIIYEPWHYRYVGREVAAEIHELDVCLEEYLEMLTIG